MAARQERYEGEASYPQAQHDGMVRFVEAGGSVSLSEIQSYGESARVMVETSSWGNVGHSDPFGQVYAQRHIVILGDSRNEGLRVAEVPAVHLEGTARK